MSAYEDDAGRFGEAVARLVELKEITEREALLYLTGQGSRSLDNKILRLFDKHRDDLEDAP